jgi:hypothetical protein
MPIEGCFSGKLLFFYVVVVGEKLLYTTTTSRIMGACFFWSFLFFFFVWEWRFLEFHKTAKGGGCFLWLQSFSASVSVWVCVFFYTPNMALC